jgi:hypothetical protein
MWLKKHTFAVQFISEELLKHALDFGCLLYFIFLSGAPRPSSSSTAQNCFSGRDLNHHKENQQEWPGKRVTLLEVVFSFSLLYTVIMHCQKDKAT